MEWFETRRCFFAIAFQLCLRVGHSEGSGKPGWFEIKWYTPAPGLCASIVASKLMGLDMHADKTKYMVKSRDLNAGLSHSIKIDHSSLKG